MVDSTAGSRSALRSKGSHKLSRQHGLDSILISFKDTKVRSLATVELGLSYGTCTNEAPVFISNHTLLFVRLSATTTIRFFIDVLVGMVFLESQPCHRLDPLQ
jgi:hypothetical protein